MFNNWMARCSKLGALHTGSTKKDEVFGDTAKDYFDEVLMKERYDIVYDVQSKYLSKGIIQEDDSITLKSFIDNEIYVKNCNRIDNTFIIGEADIRHKNTIIDIKSTWDMNTFLQKKRKPIDKNYKMQLNGYGWLWNCEDLDLTYCLVNATFQEVERQRKQLYFSLDCPNDDDDNYIRKQIELERRLIYDSERYLKQNLGATLVCEKKIFIPINERVYSVKFKIDEKFIEETKYRVIEARKYLNNMIK